MENFVIFTSMCWTLYLGTNVKLPIIELDRNLPRFNARHLEYYELGVKSRITMPDVLYLGSDQGCGCGFRHALLDRKEWYPIVEEDREAIESIQKNHQDLLEYILSYVNSGPIEIYGCWNGVVNDSIRSVEEINVKVIIDKGFYFKEGCLYKVGVEDYRL